MRAKNPSLQVVPASARPPAADLKPVPSKRSGTPAADGAGPLDPPVSAPAPAAGPVTAAAPATASTAAVAAAVESTRGVSVRSLKVASSGCAAKLRVLADPTRLAVLEALLAGPKHVGALQKLLGVEQSLLSHHLQTLRESGLVEARRDGKAVLYRIAPGVATDVGDGLDLGCCVVSFTA